MKTILIANRGLSAIKFILSIRDLYTIDEIKLIGIATPDDITSDYRYISQLDKILFAENDIYTNIENIIDLCLKNNIDAVFPGWGYLSESSEFSQKLEEHNIIFMGPSSQTIDSLGNKINSMKLAEENNVPLIKWSGSKPLLSLDDVIKSVYDIGIPCMIKEADGGGGKGIRIINTLDKSIIEQNYHQIINEMHKDIGTVKLFVMELMENCHHIEVQLVGDGIKTIHLFGRDCTSQRRNQKLIEEGPITVAPDSIIKLCEDSAIKLAESVNYLGLGTAEFLYTPKNNKLTFLEINPRLQVEHIVTELLLNINLPTILYKLTCEKFRLEQIFTTSFNYKTNTYFKKLNKLLLTISIIVIPINVFSKEDKREMVNFPDMMKNHMLANMRDHLVAINEIQISLAAGEMNKAADIAEQRLGMSSLDNHGAAHMAQMMPEGMKKIGTSMHKAASRFALKAQEGELKPALKSLSEVTSSCVACHASYKVH